MRVTVLIVSLNGRQRIHLPLEALHRCEPRADEILLVDNGSTDGLAHHAARWFPEVEIIRAPTNLGFAGGNNYGILNATGDVVVLLNDDTEPEPGWLAPILAAFEQDAALGIVGCQLLYPGGERIQHLGGIVHDNGLTDHTSWGETASDAGAELVESDYVTGAAMAIRREVFEQIGILDHGFWPIYFEETDFCARAKRAGWRIATATRSRVVHHESQTTGRLSPRFLRTYHRNRVRYLIKNRSLSEWPRTLRAEARWIAWNAPWDHLWACSLAYAWAPFQILELWRNRR